MERKAMNDYQVKDIEDVFEDPMNTDNEFYSTYMWTEDCTDPYCWYDTDKQQWYKQHVGTGIREYIE